MEKSAQIAIQKKNNVFSIFVVSSHRVFQVHFEEVHPMVQGDF